MIAVCRQQRCDLMLWQQCCGTSPSHRSAMTASLSCRRNSTKTSAGQTNQYTSNNFIHFEGRKCDCYHLCNASVLAIVWSSLAGIWMSVSWNSQQGRSSWNVAVTKPDTCVKVWVYLGGNSLACIEEIMWEMIHGLDVMHFLFLFHFLSVVINQC